MICLTTKTILTLRAEARPEGGVLPSKIEYKKKIVEYFWDLGDLKFR